LDYEKRKAPLSPDRHKSVCEEAYFSPHSKMAYDPRGWGLELDTMKSVRRLLAPAGIRRFARRRISATTAKRLMTRGAGSWS